MAAGNCDLAASAMANTDVLTDNADSSEPCYSADRSPPEPRR